MHYTTLTLPINSRIFFTPYIVYSPKETEIKYPPNISPIKMYSPTAALAILSAFELFFNTVL